MEPAGTAVELAGSNGWVGLVAEGQSGCKVRRSGRRKERFYSKLGNFSLEHARANDCRGPVKMFELTCKLEEIILSISK